VQQQTESEDAFVNTHGRSWSEFALAAEDRSDGASAAAAVAAAVAR